jgi:hypothetical protein
LGLALTVFQMNESYPGTINWIRRLSHLEVDHFWPFGVTNIQTTPCKDKQTNLA